MLNNPSLPPDDLPPADLNLEDRLLQRQLEDSLTKYFFQACIRKGESDRTFKQPQTLLSQCQWYFTTDAEGPILVIPCPDSVTNWRILKALVKLGSVLQPLANNAKIRVCPPPGTGTPFEMRVDELPVYRHSL